MAAKTDTTSVTKTEDGYRFQCSCGSKGQVRPERAEAERLAEAHLRNKHQIKPAKAQAPARKSTTARKAGRATKKAS